MTSVELKDFDAQRYDMKLPKKPTGQHPGKEALWIVEDEYDGGTLLTKPSIVVDMHGRIIVWFLPYALSRERQVRSCSFDTSHSFGYRIACREFFGRLLSRWMTHSEDRWPRIRGKSTGVPILRIINLLENVDHILEI
jgi:hypothetical protein